MKDWIDNISDDEFDEVFRAGAENHAENLWLEAWPMMEEKLEEENKKRRFVIFWRWAAAFLIFGTLGIFSISYLKSNSTEQQISKVPQGSPKTSQIKGNDIKENSQPQLGENVAIVKLPTSEPQKIVAQVKTIRANSKAISDSRNVISGNQRSLPKANKSIRKEIPAYREIAKIQDTKPEDVKQQNESQPTKSPESVVVLPTLPSSETILSQVHSNEKIDNPTTESYFSKDTVIVLSNENNAILTQSNINQMAEAKSETQPKILRNFALNLGFSPDYSRVQTSEFGAMGYNLQVILDYKITQRLTFRGGVIRSLKLYDAYPENYAWPAKWGTPSSPLKEVSATCDMWDIPLGLSYQVFEKGSNKFYSTLGLTNYKMINEKYEYSYENNADPNLKWRKWEGNSGFFGAGVVNFSLGIEHRLSKFLSLQIEPFVKIPVKNVGFGNVKLLSSGLFFNVKTHFPKKGQQPK